MGLFGFQVEEFGILLVVFFVLTSVSSGSWDVGGNAFIWAPALLVKIPFTIFFGLAGAAPILAPLAFIALVFYWQSAGQFLGRGVWTVIVLAGVIMMTI